eukprot:9377300-Heterocapsa_arctica.AAC.1
MPARARRLCLPPGSARMRPAARARRECTSCVARLCVARVRTICCWARSSALKALSRVRYG